MRTILLGISAFYHDSAAALIIDGKVIAAAQEERFSRVRHDSAFPEKSIEFVLAFGGVGFDELTAIVFYDKPFLKFERLLETYHAVAPKGFFSFANAMPVWITEKIFMRTMLKRSLSKFGRLKTPLLFPEHHLSHAASAFYPSPFQEAAILTIDGVGEWATATFSYGKENEITILKELQFPHSVGLLYSAFTDYLGFRVNSGEYKVMGLAPYGRHESEQTVAFKNKITSALVDIREDGSILLNMRYFSFTTGTTMTNRGRWENLFGIPQRSSDAPLTQEHMNLALAIQEVTEEIVLRMAAAIKALTGSKNLVLAGGVALNCVANEKIQRSGLFDGVWIQPAAGDSGGAIGAAFAAYHIYFGKQRVQSGIDGDKMEGSQLGPEFSNTEIEHVLRSTEAVAEFAGDFELLTASVAEKIAAGKTVGWFQGRMEFGPRALGNRSILADPRDPEMVRTLNGKIKGREGFRPFAPSVLEEDLNEYFSDDRTSPYMLTVNFIKPSKRKIPTENEGEQLLRVRSDVPAVTHLDYSARVQTVNNHSNLKFWTLLQAFKKKTGCSMLINTSFNVRGEPIVCTPLDAYLTFRHSGLDYLVMGNFLIDAKQQKPLPEKYATRREFAED